MLFWEMLCTSKSERQKQEFAGSANMLEEWAASMAVGGRLVQIRVCTTSRGNLVKVLDRCPNLKLCTSVRVEFGGQGGGSEVDR